MLWRDENESLPDYLDNKVFANAKSSTLTASNEDISGFSAFLDRYKKALLLERLATEAV